MAHRRHEKGTIVVSRTPSIHLDSLEEETPKFDFEELNVKLGQLENEEPPQHGVSAEDNQDVPTIVLRAPLRMESLDNGRKEIAQTNASRGPQRLDSFDDDQSIQNEQNNTPADPQGSDLPNGSHHLQGEISEFRRPPQRLYSFEDSSETQNEVMQLIPCRPPQRSDSLEVFEDSPDSQNEVIETHTCRPPQRSESLENCQPPRNEVVQVISGKAPQRLDSLDGDFENEAIQTNVCRPPQRLDSLENINNYQSQTLSTNANRPPQRSDSLDGVQSLEDNRTNAPQRLDSLDASQSIQPELVQARDHRAPQRLDSLNASQSIQPELVQARDHRAPQRLDSLSASQSIQPELVQARDNRAPQRLDSLGDGQSSQPELAQIHGQIGNRAPQRLDSFEVNHHNQNSSTKEVRIKKKASLQHHQMRILKSIKYEQELMNKFKGLRVLFSSNKNDIDLEGPQSFVQESESLLYKKASELKIRNLNLSKAVGNLVEKEKVKNYFVDACSKQNIRITWGDEPGTIYAFDKDDLDKAEELIKSEIKEHQIPADQFQLDFIQCHLKKMECQPCHLKKNFQIISEEFDRNRGHVVGDGNCFVITVVGKRCKEIDSAEKKLRELISSITREEKTIDHPGILKYFRSKVGEDALQHIRSKYDANVDYTEQHSSPLSTGLASGGKAIKQNKADVNVVIIGRSQSIVDNAWKEIIQLCDKVVIIKSLPDMKQYRKALENLSDKQMGEIDNLQQMHSVEIALDSTTSSKKVMVRGLSKDVQAALDCLPGIMINQFKQIL